MKAVGLTDFYIFHILCIYFFCIHFEFFCNFWNFQHFIISSILQYFQHFHIFHVFPIFMVSLYCLDKFTKFLFSAIFPFSCFFKFATFFEFIHIFRELHPATIFLYFWGSVWFSAFLRFSWVFDFWLFMFSFRSLTSDSNPIIFECLYLDSWFWASYL